MSLIRRVVKAGLARLGYTPINSALLETFGGVGHARQLQSLLERLQVDCVFDVGANNGQFYRFLRKEMRFAGTIISFEPLPTLSAALQRESEIDEGWCVIPLALGATDQTMRIHVTRSADMSSLLRPSVRATRRYEEYNQVMEVREIEVRRLDGLFDDLQREHGFRRPLLKTDTQGYDLNVFTGASQRLREFVALQAEIAFVPLYEGMPLFGDVIAHLEGRGFVLSGIYPLAVDEFRLIEADALWVRRSPNET